MFAKSAAFPLFPSPVWGFDLPGDDAEAINRNLLDFVRSWFDPRPPARPAECWRTPADLQERDVFAAFHPFLDRAVGTALEALAIADRNYVITGCWAEVTPPGAQQQPRCNPNTLLSGIYCARPLTPADGISFQDPRPQAGVIRPRVTRQVPETASEVEIETKPGRLLLFPSWLQHGTKPNQTSDQDRVHLGFSVMLADYVDGHTAPGWPPTPGGGTAG